MAVYQQTYQEWSGALLPRWRRIWAMTVTGLRVPFSSRWNLVVIGLIYMMVLGWLFILYILAESSAPPIFVLGNNLYREWFYNHGMFGFLLMILSATVGAALISRDLQHNALLMYFSKAITRTDYVLAKFLTLVLYLLQVTWVPGFILWVGQIGMGVEDIGWGSRFADLAAFTSHALIMIIPISAMVLAFSSLTKRPHVAGMLWVLFSLTTWLLSAVLSRAVEADWCKLLWWQNLTAHVGNQFYESRALKVSFPLLGTRTAEVKPVMKYSAAIPAVILFALTVVSFLILRLRVRIAEVRE